MATEGAFSVTANEKTIRIEYGPPLGLRYIVTIDLTDAKAIVDGIIELLNFIERDSNARVAALGGRIESLEARALKDSELRDIRELLSSRATNERAPRQESTDDLLPKGSAASPRP